MATEDLRIPLALNSAGIAVGPDEAKEGPFTCPACGENLSLHAGPRVRRHFSHLGNACSYESILHAATKRLVADYLTGRRKPEPRLSTPCGRCGRNHETAVPTDRFDAAIVEWRSPDGGFIVDVVGTKGGKPVLGIEVFVTHPVDEKKAKDIAFPWVELDADDLISNPLQWRPRACSLRPTICAPCRERRARVPALAQEKALALPAGWDNPGRPDGPYLATSDTCWKCRKATVVFWWSDTPYAVISPPEPRPKTLAFRYSKTAQRKYWVNTCQHCGASLGDNFYYGKRGDPFYALRRPGRQTGEGLVSIERVISPEDAVRKMFGGFGGLP